MVQVALIGDFNPEVKAHVAIPSALALAASELHCEIDPIWLPTQNIGQMAVEHLSGFNAYWCVPASPYRSMDGALKAIGFAREANIPFLGTCGGFQHALIEYARNVLGFTEADNAESNPASELPLITPLSCALVDTTGTISFLPNSRIASIYGTTETTEEYHCRYGFNTDYEAMFEESEIQITGRDIDGDPRVIEHSNHPFFICTLFQPERTAITNNTNPLIVEFVKSAVESKLNIGRRVSNKTT